MRVRPAKQVQDIWCISAHRRASRQPVQDEVFRMGGLALMTLDESPSLITPAAPAHALTRGQDTCAAPYAPHAGCSSRARGAVLTLSSMSFHCFCHRVSGATITLPPVLVAPLRRESSYARVAEAVLFSGSMAAATCASPAFPIQNQLSLADAGSQYMPRWRARRCSVATPVWLSSCRRSAVGDSTASSPSTDTERRLRDCALSH